MISSANFTCPPRRAELVGAAQHTAGEDSRRVTTPGKRSGQGQIRWPPPGRFHVRQRAAIWPPLGRISWPPTNRGLWVAQFSQASPTRRGDGLALGPFAGRVRPLRFARQPLLRTSAAPRVHPCAGWPRLWAHMRYRPTTPRAAGHVRRRPGPGRRPGATVSRLPAGIFTCCRGRHAVLPVGPGDGLPLSAGVSPLPAPSELGSAVPHRHRTRSRAITARLADSLWALLARAQRDYPERPAGLDDAWWLPATLGG